MLKVTKQYTWTEINIHAKYTCYTATRIKRKALELFNVLNDTRNIFLSNKQENKLAKAVCCHNTYLIWEPEEYKDMALTCSCCYEIVLTLSFTASTANKKEK